MHNIKIGGNLLNTKYLRLPNGNTIDYYNETITDTCFIVEFID